MCKTSLIGPIMLVIGILYIAVSGLLVLISLGLAGNEEATTAFGGANISSAVWLLLVAALMCPLSVTGAFGARTHNKFCLFSFCSMTSILLFTMWGVAGSLGRLSNLDLVDEEQLRCLTHGLIGGKNVTVATETVAFCNATIESCTTPAPAPSSSGNIVQLSPSSALDILKQQQLEKDKDDPCVKFMSNDYIIRLRNLWVVLHDRAFDITHEDSKKWNTFMNNMQKGRIAGYPCCGFSRPAHCTTHAGGVCSGSTQIDPSQIYYEATQICSQGKGGCRFDKPMGICAYEELKPASSGCAFTMKRWIQNQMDATASTINMLSMIPLLGLFYSLCMTFKRKHEDVLPIVYIEPKLPPKLSEMIVTKI